MPAKDGRSGRLLVICLLSGAGLLAIIAWTYQYLGGYRHHRPATEPAKITVQ